MGVIGQLQSNSDHFELSSFRTKHPGHYQEAESREPRQLSRC